MDPSAALGAGITTLDKLNQIGGAVAVLLGLLVVAVATGIILAIRAFRHMSTRLGVIEDSRVALLQGCVQDNTKAMGEVKTEIIRQTDTIHQQTAAMRTRPCLIETGVHHRTPLPQGRTV
jgi:hypothetical protein